MNRIKKLSYYLRILTQLLFILMVVSYFAFWTGYPYTMGDFREISLYYLLGSSDPVWNVVAPTAAEIFPGITAKAKLLGALINFIPVMLQLMMTYMFIKVFKLCEQGLIFSKEHVCYFSIIGYLMLFKTLLTPVYEATISYVLTSNITGLQPMIITHVAQSDFSFIFIAIAVILISYIFGEALKLKEEQDYTI